MDIQKGGFLSIEQMSELYLNKSTGAEEKARDSGMSFEKVLAQKSLERSNSLQVGRFQQQELKFSKHATLRLADRNIDLSEEQLTRLHDGAWKAKQKGIKDSLVIVDDLAFIVNIPNNTVVTAMDSTETKENVFTNINGAVII